MWQITRDSSKGKKMGEKNWMKKVVFFTNKKKLGEALENFKIKSFSEKETPVKLHMGEKKNRHFLRPEFVKEVIDKIKEYGVKPFLFDTTVAYPGMRHTIKGYLELGKINGFSNEKIGCNILIDDKGVTTTVEGRKYEVAEHLYNASYMIGLTHVKGHVATGFGGAIKNFGMGGVTKETKIRMHHGSRPLMFKDKCTYCGVCAEVCPFNALEVSDDNWKIAMNKCFGCGVCVENCNAGGISYKDENLQYVLSCAAMACIQGKNVIYINELKRIAKSCDCDPFADPIICPDIGYVVSDDIIAADKASLDLINDVKKDVFMKENHIDPIKQIDFGEKIGLGSKKYQLIEI
jgi:uncharacterized Fe-S center protein